MRLWCILWDHGEPTVKFNLLRRENFLFRLGSLLISWRKFELQVQMFRFRWTVKSAAGEP